MKQRADYPMERVRDYDAAIRRMLGFTRWMDQAILNMREGIAKGVTQPRSVIERMIAQVEMVVGRRSGSEPVPDPAEDDAGQHFRARIARASRIPIARP